jgi:hypothetical protein
MIQMTAHIKPKDAEWQIHIIDNPVEPLNVKLIQDYHDHLAETFPNCNRFILIKNV